MLNCIQIQNCNMIEVRYTKSTLRREAFAGLWRLGKGLPPKKV